MRAILGLMLLPLLAAGCASSGVNLGISLPIGNHMGVGVSVGSDGRVGTSVGVGVGGGSVSVGTSGRLPAAKPAEPATEP
jgi:hypothetical protein